MKKQKIYLMGKQFEKIIIQDTTLRDGEQTPGWLSHLMIKLK